MDNSADDVVEVKSNSLAKHPGDEYEESSEDSSDDGLSKKMMKSVCVRPTASATKPFLMQPEQPPQKLFEGRNRDEHYSSSSCSKSPSPSRKSKKTAKKGSSPNAAKTPSPKRQPASRPKAVDLNEKDGEEFRERQEQDKWVEKSTEKPKELDDQKVIEPMVLTKAGGAYIPPAKLRMMQERLLEKNSEAYQRLQWEKLKKKIHGQVNRVNITNIVEVVRALLQENVLRGKGILTRSIIQAQSFSPSFSHVFAALVAIINSKFPNIGELVLRRLIIQFKRAFRRNDKPTCVIASKFIAHLANQRVAHEVVVLEMLVLLMQNPTDDSIEVTVTLLKECGAMLLKITPKGSNAIFERLRAVLNDCDSIEKRTQYMIETMFHIRKTKFAAYPIMPAELDLIEEDDQFVHLIELNPEDGKPYDPQLELNIFKYDPEYEKTQAEYEEIRIEVIGNAQESDDEEGDEEEEDNEVQPLGPTTIVDMTEQDMVAFRRNVYLTIQSSLDFQEAAHKLIKNELKPNMEAELCHMIVDCCAQQRTYERFYGLLSERFCKLRKEFQECFEKISRDTYNAIHRFDITKLRNMAKLTAHLLATDAIGWEVLSEIKLNETETTSSGRIFIKIMFQELVEIMSLVKVYERTCDATLQTAFEGIFPRDHPKNSRFAINFFSLIGLGGLTMDLREHLSKKMAKQQSIKKEEESAAEESFSSSSSSSSSSDSESSSSSSSSSSTDSKAKKKRNKKNRTKKRSSTKSKTSNMKSLRQNQIKEELVDPEYEADSRMEKENRGARQESIRRGRRSSSRCSRSEKSRSRPQQQRSRSSVSPPTKKRAREEDRYQRDNRDKNRRSDHNKDSSHHQDNQELSPPASYRNRRRPDQNRSRRSSSQKGSSNRRRD